MDDPTRSDLALIRQALRQDWPIPPAVKSQILQRLIDYLDRDHEEGQTCSDRQVVMAAKTLVSFMKLSLDQQKLDLLEQKIAGASKGALIDLVGEAERRAVERKRERERAADGAAG